MWARENALLFILAAVIVLTWFLKGCYAQHEAAPCDAGIQAMEAGFEPADGGSSPPPATYPGPCPFKYDAVHCYCLSPTHEVCDGRYCEGPYVGCIAPGSPASSTWSQ